MPNPEAGGPPQPALASVAVACASLLRPSSP